MDTDEGRTICEQSHKTRLNLLSDCAVVEVDRLLEAAGWAKLETQLLSTRNTRDLFKSPVTGHYHTRCFALGQVLSKHGYLE